MLLHTQGTKHSITMYQSPLQR